MIELHGKKRGRSPTLPDEVVTYVMKYIRTVCDAEGVINTAIFLVQHHELSNDLSQNCWSAMGVMWFCQLKGLGKVPFIQNKVCQEESYY